MRALSYRHWRTRIVRIGVFSMLLLAIVGLALWRLLPKPAIHERQEVRLEHVSDGDSLVVSSRSGEQLRVRLIGIDTPELGTAASFRAALHAAELLESARRIELEPEIGPKGVRHDRYGRILGWVWISQGDGQLLLLQEELLRSGEAELYNPQQTGKYMDRLRHAAR